MSTPTDFSCVDDTYDQHKHVSISAHLQRLSVKLDRCFHIEMAGFLMSSTQFHFRLRSSFRLNSGMVIERAE